VGRIATPQEAQEIKQFLDRYAAKWADARPNPPKTVPVSMLLADTKTDITAGIVRSDSLTQDDEVEDGKTDKTGYPRLTPGSSSEAAWAAFIQALYGSAEFQFIR